MRDYRVVVIAGDGIGPEVVDAARAVLDAVSRQHGFALRYDVHGAGAGHYRETGRAIDAATLAACRTADGVLKGPVGDPAVRAPDGTEAGTLGGILRPGLDAYANLRPIRLFPGVGPARARNLNLVTGNVREFDRITGLKVENWIAT